MKADIRSRLLMALAALVMLPAFISPLWSIRLVAPQYPDGLGMHIYVNDVRGHERHDLQNINILNHYIGMQEIVPEEIPELDYMPWILAGLIGTGLVVALLGYPWIMAAWLLAFLGLGVAGMVDFYMWNIDYGHNLSPDAPIRIPDMTYSPPIIGSAQILNIRASSYPHLGTLYLAIAALLAGWAVVRSFRGRRAGRGAAQAAAGQPAPEASSGDSAEKETRRTTGALVTTLLLALATACGTGESPPAGSVAGAPGSVGGASATSANTERMVYGESEDPWCGELVENVRWGGEIRTTSGERLRFRSVECLAAFVLDGVLPADEIAAVRVVDFPDGWRLVPAESVRYLHTPNLASPTGLNLMAIQADKMQVNLQEAYTGPILEWNEVLELVAREWGIGQDRPS
jgi:copper chaperone NosL